MKATQIRKGNVVRIDKVLYKIMNMDHVTPGKGRAHIQTKLRKILDGTQTEKRCGTVAPRIFITRLTVARRCETSSCKKAYKRS